jgi:hypothetical protein
MNEQYPSTKFLSDAFAYALGYWQGRATGYFENGTYENMTEYRRLLYKLGYDAGVADYSEMDEEVAWTAEKFEPAVEEDKRLNWVGGFQIEEDLA